MNNTLRVTAQTAVEDELKAPSSSGSNNSSNDDDGFDVEVTVVAGDEEDQGPKIVGLAADEQEEADADVKSDKETATMLSSSDSEGNNDSAAIEAVEKPGSSTSTASVKEEKNPWSVPYIGIPINYFSVGIILGGSVSVLYPILIIQNGVTSSFYSAASSLVTLFWSYKIIFGIICDCFPIWGLKWKPYIILGWGLCAAMLVVLAGLGKGVSPTNLVVMLTFANLGYVAADVAADGYMVWMAHHEATNRRGKIQSLIYIVRSV